jgi:tetratricopeptide (TPR) repeat protein
MHWGDPRLKALIVLTSFVMGLALGFLALAASVRYGGLEGVLLRVRAEIAAYRPHPEFVPTPLATPAALPSLSASEQDVVSITPEPTAVGSVHVPLAGDERISSPAEPARPAVDQVLPTPTATPAPVHQPALESVELAGFSHFWQTWNNCGPATLAMNLSYFGSTLDQADVAASLRPNREDKNVNPEEMADFARAQGLDALVRVNGDRDRLRLLLSNGVPVLIETWLEQEPGNGLGHYRLLTGYDDAAGQWTIFDSYVSVGVDPNSAYQGIRVSYDEMESLWAVFNRTYVVLYSKAQARAVLSILGQDADEASMWQRALNEARAQVEAQPDDAFAWFNLGTDLTALGHFEEASAAYDRARVLGLPWRMLWYQFGPFRAYYETGRYQEVIVLADATIRSAGGNIEELYYWKGAGLAAQGDTEAARQAWQQALEANPTYREAAAALAGLDSPDSDGEQSPAAAGRGG